LRPSQHLSINSPTAEEDEADVDEFADGIASLQAQNRALQADLQDKNRYITTLEKRLLQARRSSHSRMSMGFSKHNTGNALDESETTTIIQEKDSEIADLRARLEDKERMVTALRSAARKRELADLTPDSSSAEFKKGTHQSNSSNDSSLASNTPITPVTPVTLLSPQKKAERKRKSVDEMSKMLDEMIQDKVESGQLVKGRTGSVRVPSNSRRHSRQASSNQPTTPVPALGSIMASLRDRDSTTPSGSAAQ
jgi:centromeric protein E